MSYFFLHRGPIRPAKLIVVTLHGVFLGMEFEMKKTESHGLYHIFFNFFYHVRILESLHSQIEKTKIEWISIS